jgi:two-component system, sensor histidine kinase LadS
VFPITVPAHGQQVVYLRVQALDGLLVPAKLWTEPDFYAYSKQDYTGQALYYGIVLAMVLFNLLLYFGLRDPIFGLYVVAELIFALALAAYGGLAHAFLWPMASNWANIAHFLGWSATFIAFGFFFRSMMASWMQGTLFDTCYQFMFICYLLAMAGMLVAPETFVLFSIDD